MDERIGKEINRAEKALKAALLLLDNELYEDSVSRAYYAVLHAVKAVLLSKNIETN